MLVNDVTALQGDPELGRFVAYCGAHVCLMHMQGEPRTMQLAPRYEDVVDEVTGSSRIGSRSRLRPGFAKSTSASTRGSASARRPTRTSSCPRARADLPDRPPVLVGLSRKSTLARVPGIPRQGWAARPLRSAPPLRPSIGRDSLPCPRRRPPCRGAGRRRGGGAGEALGDDRALRHRPARLPRRAGRGAARRPALPCRRRARSRRRPRSAQRPDRGRRRLSGRRRPRPADLGRARVPPARGLRSGDRRRARRRLAGHGVRVRVGKPDVVLDPPVERAAVCVERRRT